jgi:HSP20 family protein
MAEKTIPVPTEERKVPAGREETRGEERYITPPVDIFEEGNALKVVVDLPGVGKDSIDIRVDDNILTIQGRPSCTTPGNPVYREYDLTSFFRQFDLSEEVDIERIAADLRHGVLTLTLPKMEKPEPKKISVKVD